MTRLTQAARNVPRTKTVSGGLDIDTEKVRLAFSARTYIMGVLNVTPDSFSDGGRFLDRESAVRHARDMARDGADIIDVGGESTRPGASDIGVDEELARVIPVIERISKDLDIPISIDTRNSKVAEEAIRAGARIINDVSGLRHDSEMASVAARHKTPLIIMHMKGTPQDMQTNPTYRNVMKEVIGDLGGSLSIAKRAGVSSCMTIVDPGIGFGKTTEHNLEILNRLDELKILRRPICIGTSRKSFIGKVLNRASADERLLGTIATCVIAIMKGASLIRVHDVREAREASRMADSVLKGEGGLI